MKHRHIAIVEDDDNIRELIAENLKKAGYRASAFFTAEQFERKMDQDFDMLLLDIMLPGKSGLTLLKELRAAGRHMPVILVTASEQNTHMDTAFAAGAIDYIVKPFNLQHLLLKIQNLFTQFESQQSAGDDRELVIGAGKFDPALNMAIRDRQEYKLTPSEVTTLLYFVKNPNRIISREELQSQISTDLRGESSRNLDNYILKFRKIFEIEPKEPELFITIPRKGYALKR
ncbi:MAG: response regulator transcription factor [Leptospiraceae bacterium]|nr:response regulator transcription factor [Leptospiraceae bacterium]